MKKETMFDQITRNYTLELQDGWEPELDDLWYDDEEVEMSLEDYVNSMDNYSVDSLVELINGMAFEYGNGESHKIFFIKKVEPAVATPDKKLTWDSVRNFDNENLGVRFTKADFDALGWEDCYGPEEAGGFIDFDNYEAVVIEIAFDPDELPMTFYGINGQQAGHSFEWFGDWDDDTESLIKYLLAGDAGDNKEFRHCAEQWLERLDRFN